MRQFDDLPYATHLNDVDDLSAEGEYDCVRIEDKNYEHVDASNAQFCQSVLRTVTVTGGSFTHTRFNDVWQQAVTITGTTLAHSLWVDTEIGTSAWIAVDAIAAALRRTTFADCKLEGVNFRAATLDRVSFRDCLLRDCDFAEARLTAVTFPGTRIDGAAFNKATLKKVDFRQAASIRITDGITALHGAVVTNTQILELAPTFAAAAGLIVKD